MLVWIALPLATACSCLLAVVGARLLTWIYLAIRYLWFILPRRDQYPPHSVWGMKRAVEDFEAYLGNDVIVIELIQVYLLPMRLYTTFLNWIDACYCKYRTIRYLWRHPDVRARYLRRKRARSRKELRL